VTEAGRTPGSAAGLGPLGVWGHLDSLAIHEARVYARRVDELGYDALWVPETVGREPYVLLALLAAETKRVRLGTSIASIWGHDAQTTRMAALTLHEATGGRFVLGLGVSHPHLAQKVRGHEYDRPLSRMREFLVAYRAAIWRGRDVAGEPLVLLAALRDRMTELAASEADGAFPYLVTAERVRSMRERMERAALGRGRRLLAVTLPVVLEEDPGRAREAARAYLAPYLRTPNYQASWQLQSFVPADWEKPGSDRLVDAMVAGGSADELQRRIGELHAAGADHVALIPLAPDGTTEHLAAVEALAPRTGPR
jgi:probable F420-dependent oxidoreductase